MSGAAGKAPTDARPSVLRGRPAIKGLPKGVSGPLPKGGKFQARVTHKPSGISQRHLGLFDTVEEAEAAISGAVADLIAGSDPWNHADVQKRPYKRGQVSAGAGALVGRHGFGPLRSRRAGFAEEGADSHGKVEATRAGE